MTPAVVGMILAWGLHGDPAPQSAIVGTFGTDAECHAAVFAKIKSTEQILLDAGVTRAIVVCVDTTPQGAQSHAPANDVPHATFRFDDQKTDI